eukprot:TRINITY_DN5596_c0_g1_i4.p1 TRINITY_DN5596_c0_g1~~TRINITY_DN5596_c0_g1_i4.p1  ORF type:complete len:404 (-),score=76.89 TRINITY_DN5596_c0_g1_i4:74-1285(-)
MKLIFMYLFGILLLATSALALAPLFSSPTKINGSYIVVYRDEIPETTVSLHKTALLKMYSSHKILFEYKKVLNGFSAILTPQGLNYIRNAEGVNYVEEDQIATAFDVKQATCNIQDNAPWGLGRISTGGIPLNSNQYKYDTEGSGVKAYIVDSGIYLENVQFGGRAQFGANFVLGESNGDLNGHGTHVAGIVGGRDYGVAKKVTLVAVKVLGQNGSGSYSGVIGGIDWIATDATPNKDTANLSLGGSPSLALDTAINNLVSKNGIFTVVAAGNDNQDACNYSPSRAALAFSVGSISQPAEGVYTDPRSYFSNQGSCVQIFAPGEAIPSAWIGDPTAFRTLSGTSMASPHVCGAAALILGDGPVDTPGRVGSEIISSATPGTVVNINPDSPNLVLFAGCEPSKL